MLIKMVDVEEEKVLLYFSGCQDCIFDANGSLSNISARCCAAKWAITSMLEIFEKRILGMLFLKKKEKANA